VAEVEPKNKILFEMKRLVSMSLVLVYLTRIVGILTSGGLVVGFLGVKCSGVEILTSGFGELAAVFSGRERERLLPHSFWSVVCA
jgi:hypothetical protein